jgi:drug/metabolite transporter (DMT)-like permease
VTVALGVFVLDEPVDLAILAGAALIVAGGTALAWERVRPESFKTIGMAWAVGCTLIFASRDTFVRWFSGENTRGVDLRGLPRRLFGGLARARPSSPAARPGGRGLPFVPAGLFFGLSYVCLFEAYYRGRVSVVSPLVAT